MKTISAELFRTCIASGALEIENHRNEVNDLNVFPVPDGDTGANMEATMLGGVRAMEAKEDFSVGELAGAMSRGMLLSARGNSGVILSQFFAGFAGALKKAISIDVPLFQKALESGVKTAYKAVIKPTEGTVLTVMRLGQEKGKEVAKEGADFSSYLKPVLSAMQKALEDTPNLLPILKESGVIDSGGQGFVYIFTGIARAIEGDLLAPMVLNSSPSSNTHQIDLSAYNEDSHLNYGYCTEFLLQLTKEKCDVKNFDLKQMIAFLEGIGDSLVCFQTGTLIKVHVHTKDPDAAIAYAKKFGDFVAFKMENMALQHNETIIAKESRAMRKNNERVKLAAIAVSPSAGISNMFRGYGVRVIVESNELMNPSGEDFIQAFDEANADTIFLFPNNKNEIMVAHQAAKLYKKSWIYVIETKDIPSGLAAASVMDVVDFSVDDNLKRIENELNKINTYSITVAAHDSTSGSLKIKKNEYMGMLNGKIVVKASNLKDCFGLILDKDSHYLECSLITLVYGKSLSEDDKDALKDVAISKNDWVEIAESDGEQGLYPLYAFSE